MIREPAAAVAVEDRPDAALRRATERARNVDDWNELRVLGHRVIDDLIQHLSTIRSRAVVSPIPEEARRALKEPAPTHGVGPAMAYDTLLANVLPYSRGNGHPRFWGWVNGSGLFLGALGDLIASAMNTSVATRESGATLVEAQVLSWIKQALNVPDTWSGLLTSGCSMSHVIALATARHAALGEVRTSGLAASARRLVVYASTETHGSVQRAVELVGIGAAHIRRIPCSPGFTIDVRALADQISADRAAGHSPFLVVGNAGSVNTGAIDDLDALNRLCAAERLWLHVDGAFGAWAWLCEEMHGALSGLQAADSLACDLHKWMYLPFDVGCVLINRRDVHRDAFAIASPYLECLQAEPPFENPADYGVELTRRFRALKVWLTVKAYGLRTLTSIIRDNLQQATTLGDLIQASTELELLAPVSLNVVCFRYVGAIEAEWARNAFNAALLARLQTRAMFFPSHTTLHGCLAIRVAITNHRTTLADIHAFVADFRAEAQRLLVGGPELYTGTEGSDL